jgi:hypothetical protein
MVLFTRSLSRLIRPALTPAGCTAARASPHRRTRGPVAWPQHQLGGIRTLTSIREKVKVLLVLYDGGKHAEEVSSPPSPTVVRIRITANLVSLPPPL